MPQEMKMIEAIKIAIQTEKDVMDFYLKAAALTNNERGKKIFEQLAAEEREHAGHFFEIYTGSDLGSFEDFMAQPPNATHSMLKQLEEALDENVHERRAMELAMKEEEDLDPDLVAKVTAGLTSEDPAHDIRNALNQHPDDRDRWYLYRSDRIRGLIERWLADRKIQPSEPPSWNRG